MNQRRVLILCSGNSCRSQMAEEFWRLHGRPHWEAFSAGTNPTAQVHPLAVSAMAERGIDLSRKRPRSSDEYAGQRFDLVITVCGNAERECPAFPGATRRLHWPFDDPPHAPGDEAARLAVCRRVRDEIEARILDFLKTDNVPA